MYVSTFYSYKGGVGRTMALINVAYLLALSGKRVLIVDFDLEAPGIPSFDLFRCAEGRPGLVDYVTAYRDTGRSPDVADFIIECENESNLPIWLMPAGRHTMPGYAEKLYSIDWKDLYDNHAGFLMFEDLRHQWGAHDAKFDYVLIDSRTGHTDVGGICTRQLPNAVVVMFLPNEQNIEGLEPIVSAIRAEEKGIRGPIDLHFCPSNVPDLDDENEILSRLLERAQIDLGPASATIHHYNSLDLLTQPAFTACRPNSQLAREYRKLMEAIISLNFEDVTGAELALSRMPDRYEGARRDGDQTALIHIERSAAQISALHPDNGRIGLLLSILYSRMGAVEDEINALNVAIEHDYDRNRCILRRARLLSSLNRKDPARSDLHQLLSSGTATAFEVLPAIDLLRAIDPLGWVSPIQTAIDQLQVSGPVYAMLMQSLMTERDKLPLAIRMGRHALSSATPELRKGGEIQSQLILSLIGLGDFDLAMETITPERESLFESKKPDDIFNFAVAQWGSEGEPPADLFEHVLSVLGKGAFGLDANLLQCRALAQLVLHRFDAATESLEAARSRARAGVRAFSCWRYLQVSGREMLTDLSQMAETLGGDAPFEPPFFREVRRLVA